MKTGKQKSHRGARKRFRVTGTGKVMAHRAFKRHILTKKSRSRKRALRMARELAPGDAARLIRLLA